MEDVEVKDIFSLSERERCVVVTEETELRVIEHTPAAVFELKQKEIITPQHPIIIASVDYCPPDSCTELHVL